MLISVNIIIAKNINNIDDRIAIRKCLKVGEAVINYLFRVQQAINYIEENLTEAILNSNFEFDFTLFHSCITALHVNIFETEPASNIVFLGSTAILFSTSIFRP